MAGSDEILLRHEWHIRIVRRYKESWLDRHFRFSLPLSILLFIGALYVNFWAIGIATEKASSSVTDIILSNTAAIEGDGLFVYGTFIMIAFAALLLLARPNRIPFALHGLTL